MALMKADFSELMKNLRRGCNKAAETIVIEYGPLVRRTLRLRLYGPSSKRIFDSSDICQSVLVNFFVYMKKDGGSFEDPKQLARFLTVMTNNKFFDKVRQHKKVSFTELKPDLVADPQKSVEETLSLKESREEVQNELTAKEFWLIDQRIHNRPWEEIAKELDTTIDAARKQHERLLKRIREKLANDLADNHEQPFD